MNSTVRMTALDAHHSQIGVDGEQLAIGEVAAEGEADQRQAEGGQAALLAVGRQQAGE